MINKTDIYAPIILFVYNRLMHTKKTVESLQANKLAEKSELIIYSDAAKNADTSSGVQEVRDYIKTINGFKKVTTIERDKNYGLANSIIDGVSKIVNEFGKIIVLEDDMVTSPYFLEYMNESLNLYADNDDVISIHGYVYPVHTKLPTTFFLKGADCWGWATWQRGWDLFNSDGKQLLEQLKNKQLLNEFNFSGAFNYSSILQDQIKGNIDSWAVRWYASAFLNNKLTLYPGKSLVQNIGNDASGTHCANNFNYNVILSNKMLKVGSISIVESVCARNAFIKYGLSLQSIRNPMVILKKLLNRIFND